MSWYRDPQLFIYRGRDSQFRIVKINKEIEIGNLVVLSDMSDIEVLNFSKHLSLGHNKESDYEAFKSSFPKTILKFVNSQGFVVNWDGVKYSGTWSREDINSPFYSLPTFQQALQKKVSELEVKGSALQDEIKREKEQKQSLDKKVSELEAENLTLQADVKMCREEKQTFGEKVSKLEAQNSVMQDEVKRNEQEKQFMGKRVSELESEIAALQDEIKRNKIAKQSIDNRLSELEAENFTLQDKVNQNNKEKESMNKKVAELEAENSTLRDEVKREKDEKREMAGKQEKRYLDLETAILHLYGKKAREDTLAALEADIARLNDKKKQLTEDINASTKLLEQMSLVKNNKPKECCDTGNTTLKYWVPFEKLNVQTS